MTNKPDSRMTGMHVEPEKSEGLEKLRQTLSSMDIDLHFNGHPYQQYIEEALKLIDWQIYWQLDKIRRLKEEVEGWVASEGGGITG